MKFSEKIKTLFGIKEKALRADIESSIYTHDVDLSTLEENDFFTLLSKVLEKNTNRAVLFGAISMSVYGYQRNTLDVDFMLPEDDFKNFTNILESIGYHKVLQTSQYAKFRHKNDAFMDIDTVFIAANTADEIIKLAEIKNIRGENAFLCASLETILATKLHAIQYNNECREGKDVIDIRMLVKANNIDIHSKWFRTLCTKYGGEDLYNNIFVSKGKED